MQTGITRKLIEKIERKCDARITVGGIGFIPGYGVIIKDILILDSKPYTKDEFGTGMTPVDTFFQASSITASFMMRDLIGTPHIRSVVVKDAQFNMCTEPDFPYYRTNLRRIFKLQKKVKKQNDREVFLIRNVRIDNFTYRLKNFRQNRPEYKGFGLNWSDLDVCTSIEAHELRLAGGVMSGIADRLDAHTSCGYEILSLTGAARVGRGKTIITNFHLNDEWTDLLLRKFTMYYGIGNGLRYFASKVKLHGELGDSRLNMQTVRYFTGGKKDNRMSLRLADGGTFDGIVQDLRAENIVFEEIASGIDGTVNSFHMQKSEGPGKLNLEFDINPLNFSLKSVGKLSGKAGKLNSDTPLSLSLKGEGNLKDLKAEATLTQKGSGNISTKVQLLDLSGGPIGIDGTISGRNFNIGRLLGKSDIGDASLDGSFEALMKPHNPFIVVDSLLIDKLEYKGHAFRNIAIDGDYSKEDANIRLSSSDSALEADINAGMHAGTYKVQGTVNHADLEELGLSKKAGGITYLAASVDAYAKSLKKEALVGDISLGKVRVAKDGHFADAGDLSIKARGHDSTNVITLMSSIMHGSYEGKGKAIEAELSIHDRHNFLGLMVPGLILSDDTHLSLNSDGKGTTTGNLTSQKITYKKNTLKNASIDFDFRQGNVSALMGSNYTQTGKARLDNTRLKIEGKIEKGDNKSFSFSTPANASYLRFNDQKWDLSAMRFDKTSSGMSISDFYLHNGEQGIFLDGGISGYGTDTLKARINNLQLDVVNKILPSDLGLSGKVNADAVICSPTRSKAEIDAELVCDSIRIKDYEAGTIRLGAEVRNKMLSFEMKSSNDSLIRLDAAGVIDNKKKTIDASASFNHMRLDIAQPFLMNSFSEMGGEITGGIKVKGPLKDFSLSSDSLRLDKARAKIALTNVAYTFDGPLAISSKSIGLDQIKITDDFKGKASLQGSVSLDKSKDKSIDIRLTMNELKVLDSNNANSIYGTAALSGSVGVEGGKKGLEIDVDAMTAGKNSIHVPLARASAKDGEMLSFREPVSFYDEDDAIRKERKKKSKLTASVRLQVNPETEAVVEIDKSQGHMITAYGEGDISVDYKSESKDLKLGGDYIINAGKYKFSALQTVIQKDFQIKSGSLIKLNGDAKNTSFDITALYNTKASIAPLISNASTSNSRRNIVCGIKMTDKIDNPSLHFSIDIPDLDPATQSQVQGALNTDDKVQKQFLALLLTGSFIPVEQSGVVFSGGNAVYNNLTNIVSGQLNNILQQLNIPLDMGLNYQQGDSGENIFDVAVSTQLFHNRVLVNGSIGNKVNSSNKADVVGDLDIEVKIDKNGKFRFKAFSHSADDYTNFLDNLQRNGAGISFQTEFNSFSQLWKRTFGPKIKRLEYKLQQIKADRVMKTIKLND